MKTIYQLSGEDDCSAAALAMLLGWSRDDAHVALYRDLQKKAKPTKTVDICRVLEQNSIDVEGRRKKLAHGGLQLLGRNALVFGTRDNNVGHWLVWDAKQKCLRDPDGFGSPVRIISYLAVGGNL